MSNDPVAFGRTLTYDNRGSINNGSFGWSAFSGTGQVIGGSPIIDNEWTMLTVVYDQAAQTAALYVNGTLIQSKTGVTTPEGRTELTLGDLPGNPRSL